MPIRTTRPWRLAAEGHRVIIVVATDGFMGPATGDGAQTRLGSFAQSSGRSARLARVMLGLPVSVFGLLFGREWFVEPGPRKRRSAATF